MPITVAVFRANFPEFSDTGKYPDTMVQLWLNQAYIQLPEKRWLNLHPMGLQLFTAHQLVVAARAAEVAHRGGAPGAVVGPVASKSVDKVSVSYNSGSVALTDGGFWNLTTYGVQFLQMARMVGAGGAQL